MIQRVEQSVILKFVRASVAEASFPLGGKGTNIADISVYALSSQYKISCEMIQSNSLNININYIDNFD